MNPWTDANSILQAQGGWPQPQRTSRLAGRPSRQDCALEAAHEPPVPENDRALAVMLGVSFLIGLGCLGALGWGLVSLFSG